MEMDHSDPLAQKIVYHGTSDWRARKIQADGFDWNNEQRLYDHQSANGVFFQVSRTSACGYAIR